MARPGSSPSPRSIEAIADSNDLRGVIIAALSARPIEESALRAGVWTYVGCERHAGASPGQVIMDLTAMIDEAGISPNMQKFAVTRRVILWCVEAYFGHLGGDVMDCDTRALSDSDAARTP